MKTVLTAPFCRLLVAAAALCSTSVAEAAPRELDGADKGKDANKAGAGREEGSVKP